MTDSTRNKSIKNYDVLQNADGVRRFISFCNYYRRFKINFAKTGKSLNDVLKKNHLFIWSEQCQHSFELLKSKIVKPATTDASDFALSVVLS